MNARTALTDEAIAFLTAHIRDYAEYSQHYPYSMPDQAIYLGLRESDARRIIADSGSHFFDRTAMRFFNSRLAPGMVAGRFFITSERFESDPREYSVRWAYRYDGTDMIQTERFTTRFASLDSARRFAKRAAALLSDAWSASDTANA